MNRLDAALALLPSIIRTQPCASVGAQIELAFALADGARAHHDHTRSDGDPAARDRHLSGARIRDLEAELLEERKRGDLLLRVTELQAQNSPPAESKEASPPVVSAPPLPGGMLLGPCQGEIDDPIIMGECKAPAFERVGQFVFCARCARIERQLIAEDDEIVLRASRPLEVEHGAEAERGTDCALPELRDAGRRVQGAAEGGDHLCGSGGSAGRGSGGAEPGGPVLQQVGAVRGDTGAGLLELAAEGLKESQTGSADPLVVEQAQHEHPARAAQVSQQDPEPRDRVAGDEGSSMREGLGGESAPVAESKTVEQLSAGSADPGEGATASRAAANSAASSISDEAYARRIFRIHGGRLGGGEVCFSGTLDGAKAQAEVWRAGARSLNKSTLEYLHSEAVGQVPAGEAPGPRWGTAAGSPVAWHLWREGAAEAECGETSDADTEWRELPPPDASTVCLDCVLVPCRAGREWRKALECRVPGCGLLGTEAGRFCEVHVERLSLEERQGIVERSERLEREAKSGHVLNEEAEEPQAQLQLGAPTPADERKQPCVKCTKPTVRRVPSSLESHVTGREALLPYQGQHLCPGCFSAIADVAKALRSRKARASDRCQTPGCEKDGTAPPDQRGARFCTLHISNPLSIRREDASAWRRAQKLAAVPAAPDVPPAPAEVANG